MQILNKNVNMRNDVCYRVTSNGKICDIDKEQLEKLITPFNELRSADKSVANIEDLKEANILARQKSLVRVRKLEEEQLIQKSAGFALVGGITCIGVLAVVLIIFITISMLVLG